MYGGGGSLSRSGRRRTRLGAGRPGRKRADGKERCRAFDGCEDTLRNFIVRQPARTPARHHEAKHDRLIRNRQAFGGGTHGFKPVGPRGIAMGAAENLHEAAGGRCGFGETAPQFRRAPVNPSNDEIGSAMRGPIRRECRLDGSRIGVVANERMNAGRDRGKPRFVSCKNAHAFATIEKLLAEPGQHARAADDERVTDPVHAAARTGSAAAIVPPPSTRVPSRA